MGSAESPQEGCMPVFCIPGKNKGHAYIRKVAKSKPRSWPSSSLCHARTPAEHSAECKANLEERISTARVHCIQVR